LSDRGLSNIRNPSPRGPSISEIAKCHHISSFSIVILKPADRLADVTSRHWCTFTIIAVMSIGDCHPDPDSLLKSPLLLPPAPPGGGRYGLYAEPFCRLHSQLPTTLIEKCIA